MSDKAKTPGEKGYRHELKYYITLGEYELLQRKLSLTMERDAFAKKRRRVFYTQPLL